MKKITKLFLLTLLLTNPLGRYLIATENGDSDYLPGFYGDFQMGSMPSEKGFYLNNLLSAYQDPKAVTGNVLEMPGIIYVTEHKILGGSFSTGIWPGMQITKDNNLAKHSARLGMVDPYIMPALLSWDWGKITADIFEGIVVPAGFYAKNQLSTGSNIWTFDHNFAATINLPANNEISIDLGYMNNTQNPATHYTNGDEVHFDYTAGHYLDSEFALGIVGSYYQQVSADQAPANLLAKVYTAADSIGPVMMFTPHIGKKPVNMSLKWQHEFDVQGRLAQDYLIWRVFSAF